MRLLPVRLALVGAALAAAVSVGACGGGPAATPEPAAPPGAAVDPQSSNVVTDPINRAKAVAADAAQHDEQESQLIEQMPR